SCAVSGLIGAYMMFANVIGYSVGAMGVFLYPSLVNSKTGDMSGMYAAIIASIAAVVIAFLIQYFVPVPTLYGNPDTKQEEPVIPKAKELQSNILASPMIGKVVKLADVPDEVFASGAMGAGITIDPTDGIVVAPANAEVTLLFPTKHAIGLKTEDGLELLIHVGMDTVSLAGKGFKSFVEVGDTVQAGQKLLEFDVNTIKEAGLPVIAPIVITNSADFEDVLTTQESRIDVGDYLLTVVK
ncbi:MAG: PTS glucose transporter subunit IIA, partial [Streptococcus sp.]|nr:PTS glucose transporter subunit IIA [Streptococcus sp.]